MNVLYKYCSVHTSWSVKMRCLSEPWETFRWLTLKRVRRLSIVKRKSIYELSTMKRSDEQRCKGNSNQHITTSSGNPIKSLIRTKTRGFNGALTIKLLNSQTIFIIMSMVRRKTLLLPIIVQDRVTLIYANHRVETKMLHPIRGWQSHWRAAKKSPQKSKCNKIKTLLKYHPFTQTILKRLNGKTHST